MISGEHPWQGIASLVHLDINHSSLQDNPLFPRTSSISEFLLQQKHQILAGELGSDHRLYKPSCFQIVWPFPTKAVDGRWRLIFSSWKERNKVTSVGQLKATFLMSYNHKQSMNCRYLNTSFVCLSLCLAQYQLSEGLLNLRIKSIILDQIETNSFLKFTVLTVSKGGNGRLFNHIKVIPITQAWQGQLRWVPGSAQSPGVMSFEKLHFTDRLFYTYSAILPFL